MILSPLGVSRTETHQGCAVMGRVHPWDIFSKARVLAGPRRLELKR